MVKHRSGICGTGIIQDPLLMTVLKIGSVWYLYSLLHMFTWYLVCNSSKTWLGAWDAWLNASQLLSLLAHDSLSLLACLVITYAHLAAGNLLIRTLAAKQWPTSTYTYYDCLLCKGFWVLAYSLYQLMRTGDLRGAFLIQHSRWGKYVSNIQVTKVPGSLPKNCATEK